MLRSLMTLGIKPSTIQYSGCSTLYRLCNNVRFQTTDSSSSASSSQHQSSKPIFTVPPPPGTKSSIFGSGTGGSSTGSSSNNQSVYSGRGILYAIFGLLLLQTFTSSNYVLRVIYSELLTLKSELHGITSKQKLYLNNLLDEIKIEQNKLIDVQNNISNILLYILDENNGVKLSQQQTNNLKQLLDQTQSYSNISKGRGRTNKDTEQS